MSRLRPILAWFVLALAAGEALSAAQTRGGAASAGARRPAARLSAQPEGSILVQASAYRAVIGSDGNLHSLRVGDAEMLHNRVAISPGSFFYADGPRYLEQVTQRGPDLVEATDGTHIVQYRFLSDEIRVALRNGGAAPVSYFVILSPQVTIVTSRPSGDAPGEAAAAPANEHWGDVRFGTRSGAYLELSGGSRIWGPWLGRQVWEVSRIPAGHRKRIRLRPGLGDPPKATLEQLVGMSIAPASDDGLVAAEEPVKLEVAIDNRSERTLDGLLSIELFASRSDLITYSTSSLKLPAKQVTTTTLQRRVSAPDFYTARATLVAEGREVATASATAGYSAPHIRSAVKRPADFSQFWQRFLADVGDEPPQFRMVLDSRRSRANVGVWVLQYKSIADKTIYGWYLLPHVSGRLPAVLYLSGYGARPIDPPLALAGRGFAVLAIDVRGNQVDKVRPRPFENYCTQGIESPESYVYREILGHALRAVQFLRAREEVHPARIAAIGVSEGGGIALLLAALTPQVRAVAADAPMLSDFPLSLRSAAWPYTEIARYLRRHPEADAQVARTLAHFDALNFAADVNCPVLLSVGLLDRVSLPAAVYGLFNRLDGPKEVRALPNAGHEGGGEDMWAYKLEWLADALTREVTP